MRRARSVGKLGRALATVSALLLPPAAASGQPNVVILLADDLGWNDVGYHNSSVRTPNIDRLAKQGIELDRFYVDPTCSPTRASLMTGLFSTRHGVNVPIQWHTENGLPLEYKILPQYFKEAGYSTHLVGKWHLGHRRRDYLPNQRGFDSFYGFVGGAVGYYDHLFAGGIDWQRDGVTVEEEGYTTELIAREAARVIKESAGGPYFLLVAFNAPHTPIQGPGGARAEHEGRKTYLEMAGALDTAIGRVMEALREANQLTDTLVLFASDNGGQEPVPFWMEWLIPPTADGFADNGILRADKGRVYEGGIRVPAAIWWPGTLDSDVALEQPLHVADLLPTLAEAVGFPVADLDGESQWSSLISGEAKPRRAFIVSNMGSEAMIDWPWKLVKEASLPFVPEFFASETYYLYNLELDPEEIEDLAATQPEVFGRMKKDLQGSVRRNVIELDFSQEAGHFGGGVSRKAWAESLLEPEGPSQ